MIPFVPSFVPEIVQALPFALAFSLLCANWLRSFPGAFYALFAFFAFLKTAPQVILAIPPSPLALADIARTAGTAIDSSALLSAIVELTASSYAGIAIYLIVMYVGALERTRSVRRILSVRSELSVIGGIVVAGHLVRVGWMPFMYAIPGFADAWGKAASGWMFVAVALIGLVLTVCFLLPWLASFKRVRERLGHARWKRVQMLAYPFMATMVLQGFFLSVGHALSCVPSGMGDVPYGLYADPAGWLSSFAGYVATASFYAFAGILYVALRLHRRAVVRERRRRSASPSREEFQTA